jgi:hypothetical protein
MTEIVSRTIETVDQTQCAGCESVVPIDHKACWVRVECPECALEGTISGSTLRKDHCVDWEIPDERDDAGTTGD